MHAAQNEMGFSTPEPELQMCGTLSTLSYKMEIHNIATCITKCERKFYKHGRSRKFYNHVSSLSKCGLKSWYHEVNNSKNSESLIYVYPMKIV